MALPEPQPGLVVRYAHLWRDEATLGRDEGTKDRPCVVIVAVQNRGDKRVVTVAPTTRTPVLERRRAVEMPAHTKRRLGLDDRPSWIVTDDLNQFVWPGPDIRPVLRARERTFAYGVLPTDLYQAVRGRIVEHVRARTIGVVNRDKAGP